MVAIHVDAITSRPIPKNAAAFINGSLAVLAALFAASVPLAFVAGIEYIRIYQP